MKKMTTAAKLILLTFPVGIVIGATFLFMRFFRTLEISGLKNFPKQGGKIVLVSNHPSKTETILMIGLFFRKYLFRPFKHAPWTLTDRLWYEKWIFFMIRPRLIPVDRPRFGKAESMEAAKEVLASGGNIIIFSEGTRTPIGKGHLYSRSGKRLLPLKKGVAILATEPGTTLVPVWVEYPKSLKIKMVIGEPVSYEGTPKEVVLEKITKTLLDLADQANEDNP
jgi:1-acyl-sn-glycerol-3-phosphate acyltransferase